MTIFEISGSQITGDGSLMLVCQSSIQFPIRKRRCSEADKYGAKWELAKSKLVVAQLRVELGLAAGTDVTSAQERFDSCDELIDKGLQEISEHLSAAGQLPAKKSHYSFLIEKCFFHPIVSEDALRVASVTNLLELG